MSVWTLSYNILLENAVVDGKRRWKESVGWGKRARKNLNFDKMRSTLLKSED